MATYQHFAAEPPPPHAGLPAAAWADVMGSTYSATGSYIQITNIDGTLTIAHGAFNVVGNTVLSGTITSLDHRGADGTIYEEITGTSVDAHQFLAAAPADKLAGALSGADDMVGHSGPDTLNGYGGADHMAGGAGDDQYVVDSTLDVVTETLNQGYDTITTGLSSYTLGANLERLIFTGTGPHTGYGNSLDNSIQGGTGHDTLYGFDGNDSFGSGGGGDTMIGGAGNDTYAVVAGDTIVELANEGIDQVQTSLANYILPANVEDLLVSGSGPEFGNGLDNLIETNGAAGMTIYGLDGNDHIIAYGDNNTLVGGNGDDRLQQSGGDHVTMNGGSGDDVFVIDGNGHAAITDFTAGPGVHDRIDLEAFRPGGYLAGQTAFHNLSDVLAHATQNGADTVISLGAGSSLTLQNVLKSALSADDFVWGQTPQDFKGDSVSDILWHNDNGANSIWDNGQVGGAHVISSAGGVDASWHIAGTGDFDGNGHGDILWHNDNGAVSIWDNGNINQAHVIAAPGAVDSTWHIAGVADFDRDGQSDILWHNDNGAASIWKNGDMNSANVIAQPGQVSTSWHIAGTGDFDGNGLRDVLWQNDNGAVSIWDNADINKAHVIANPGQVPDNWHFAGTGDFDGNGHDDILWHNDNGAVSIWDNGNINQAHVIADAGAVASSWHIAGTGDYDGNRQTDILWHNDNGAVSVWDNGQIGNAHVVATGIDASWHIA
jgi:Ca2+-binding RTX toxin-like protein